MGSRQNNSDQVIIDLLAAGLVSENETNDETRRNRVVGGNLVRNPELISNVNTIMNQLPPLLASSNVIRTHLLSVLSLANRAQTQPQPSQWITTAQSDEANPVTFNSVAVTVDHQNSQNLPNESSSSRTFPGPSNLEAYNNQRDGGPENNELLTPPRVDQQNSQDDDNNPDDEQAQLNSLLLGLIPNLFKYAPIVLLLSSKFVIDNFVGILSFCALVITFYNTDSVVQSEAIKPADRSLRALWLSLFISTGCMLLFFFVSDYGSKYSNFLIMLPPNEKLIGLWQMLWIITVTDFILRLLTINFKIVITLLPERIFPFKKRGKIYCFAETLSQMYRSLVPIQPWIIYLLESYDGYGKVYAVLLTSGYIASKGFEFVRRAIVLRKAFDQLLMNSNIGTTPTKSQIDTAGQVCPICHEEYISPVLLSCSHIFCEMCVSVWLNKVQTCPLCRAQVITSSTWRNGATSQYIQVY